MMNTVLGLLAKGDINCAGGAVDPNGDLFSPQKPTSAQSVVDMRPARQVGEIPAGVVLTEAEKKAAEAGKKAAEEEKRRLEEEEQRLKREEELREKAEQERIRKENSFWNKAIKGLKNFGKTIIEEE
jgi:cell division protein FtsA